MPEPAFLRQFDLQTCTETEPADMALHRNRRTKTFDADGKLIGLNLCGCGVRDLAFLQLSDCQHLQALNLSENPGLKRIQIPAELRHLRHLNVSENPDLTELQFEAGLPALETLLADQCQLRALRLPSGFAALRKLDCRQNQLAQVDFEEGCPALEFLDLSQNKLRGLRLPLGFEQLRFLYLNDNQLSELHFEAPLRRLEVLHLRKNDLRDFPDNLLSFTSLQTLYLHGNNFQGSIASLVPKEERQNAKKPVFDYLNEFRKGTIVNNRVKIIIVGNGRVGKTSMFRRLRHLPFDPLEKFTHGVQLGTLEKKHLPQVKTERLHASVWDFGGQEIFYATHQFFLTDNALYILAWTAEENVKAYRERDTLTDDEKWRSNEYWLDNIRHHSKQSPILMARTHCDKVRPKIDETEFGTAPYHAECLDFCAADDSVGLSTLQKLITERLNTAIPTFGEDFPETFDHVIGLVEAKKPDNKITREAFDKLCRDAKITPGAEESVLDFLRVTGTVVWLPQVDSLKGTIFVNPDWLTQQVYRIINHDLRQRRGRFDAAYVAQMLPDHTEAARAQFIELLIAFQLIFEAENGFVAPQYLPDQLDGEAKNAYEMIFDDLDPAFTLRFPKFVPDNVMVNFLSQYGPFSRKMYWKNGICFTDKNKTKCIVNFEEVTRSLHVFTKKDDSLSLNLQAEVCAAFVKLSKGASDMLNAEIALAGGPFVAWQDLEEAQRDGIESIRATDKSKVAIADYDRFLTQKDVLEDRGEPKPDKPKPTVFFSYAWGINEVGENREAIVDQLYDSLAADDLEQLIRDKKDNGYRKSIRAFMQKIGRGKLVVVVISDKYLKSDKCMFELLEIFKKSNSEKEEFKDKIFPIVLSDAKIYDPIDRLDYVAFWQKKCKELEKRILEVGLAAAKATMPDYETWDDIMRNIGLLAGVLADLNTLDPQTLSDDNFLEIKKAIRAQAEKLNLLP